MTRKLKTILWLIFASVLFQSCNKSSGLSNAEALTRNDWHPYQTRIVTYDTITVITTDSNFIRHISSTTSHFDTTYLFDPCLQQSTYSFQTNGRLEIRNLCSAGQPAVDTSWTLYPNKVLLMLFITDTVAYSYYYNLYPVHMTFDPGITEYETGTGSLLTRVSSSQLEITQPTAAYLASSHHLNNSEIDSITNITSNRIITFNSR